MTASPWAALLEAPRAPAWSGAKRVHQLRDEDPRKLPDRPRRTRRAAPAPLPEPWALLTADSLPLTKQQAAGFWRRP